LVEVSEAFTLPSQKAAGLLVAVQEIYSTVQEETAAAAAAEAAIAEAAAAEAAAAEAAAADVATDAAAAAATSTTPTAAAPKAPKAAEPIAMGADDFLPIFIFCLVQANWGAPCSTLLLLRLLADPLRQHDELQYYLTMLEAAFEVS
jgi:hypothetical protein